MFSMAFEAIFVLLAVVQGIEGTENLLIIMYIIEKTYSVLCKYSLKTLVFDPPKNQKSSVNSHALLQIISRREAKQDDEIFNTLEAEQMW